MNLLKHGPLAGAAIFVVAMVVLIAETRVPLPDEIRASLEVREAAFLARFVPPPDGTPATTASRDALGTASRSVLEDLARKSFATGRDRMIGAATAMASGSPQLVPVFLAPMTLYDPLARRLVEWSFDPAWKATATDLAGVRSAGLPPHLEDAAVETLARTSDLPDEAATARASAQARWATWVTASGAIGLLFIGMLVAGFILWRRVRRQPSRLGFPGLGGPSDLLGPARVLIWSAAVWLTIAALLPRLLQTAGVEHLSSWILQCAYVANGLVAFWLVGRQGLLAPGESIPAALGFEGSFAPRDLPRSALRAFGANCMAWPAVIGMGFLSGVLFGGGRALDNSTAAYLVTSQDAAATLALFGAAALLAPLFEEPLFRGFLYGRLRRRMPPGTAALASGLVFGAAHMSLPEFLPLAALGYTLAIVYERSGDLAVPVLAHALWNAGNGAALLLVFG